MSDASRDADAGNPSGSLAGPMGSGGASPQRKYVSEAMQDRGAEAAAGGGFDEAAATAALAGGTSLLGRAALQVGALVVTLGLWTVASAQEWVSERILPPPLDVWRSFWNLVTDGILFDHVGVTLWEVFAGFVLGSAGGFVIAVAGSVWVAVSSGHLPLHGGAPGHAADRHRPAAVHLARFRGVPQDRARGPPSASSPC